MKYASDLDKVQMLFLNTKCLGCDRCEVRLGSWRSSDASLNTKCLGCDRCEVRLGSWRNSDASLRNESSFLALVACERVIPPPGRVRRSFNLRGFATNFNLPVLRRNDSSLRKFPVHCLQPKCISTYQRLCELGANQSECWFLLVISTDEMSLNLSKTMK